MINKIHRAYKTEISPTAPVTAFNILNIFRFACFINCQPTVLCLKICYYSPGISKPVFVVPPGSCHPYKHWKTLGLICAKIGPSPCLACSTEFKYGLLFDVCIFLFFFNFSSEPLCNSRQLEYQFLGHLWLPECLQRVSSNSKVIFCVSILFKRFCIIFLGTLTAINTELEQCNENQKDFQSFEMKICD